MYFSFCLTQFCFHVQTTETQLKMLSENRKFQQILGEALCKHLQTKISIIILKIVIHWSIWVSIKMHQEPQLEFLNEKKTNQMLFLLLLVLLFYVSSGKQRQYFALMYMEGC